MRNAADEKKRRRLAAEGLGLRLTPERIDAVAPVLADLDRKVRAALDRELALVEPAVEFQPDGE